MPTILIVEDNPSVAKFYALALKRRGGMDCVLAHSATEVLERARAGEVDLVLLDVSLANFTYEGHPIDGLELARLLKQDAATARLPILLATAHAMAGDRERLLQASGADEYVQKPIYDSEVLVEKIRGLLGKP